MNQKQNKQGNPGNRYTEEFKQKIIYLYLAGRSIKSLSIEHGIPRLTIYRWRKLYDPFVNSEKEAVSLEDCEKLKKKIQKKIDRLKMQNEIIKKGFHEIELNKYMTQNIVAFINKYQDQYPIQLMCKLFNISRTTYYNTINQLGYNKKRYT